MSIPDDVRARYEKSFGFVPPAIELRYRLGERTNPEVIAHVEAIRNIGTEPKALTPRDAQVITFALLLAQKDPGARNHALAAQRLGVTEAELAEAAVLAYIQAGLGALNLGATILKDLFP